MSLSYDSKILRASLGESGYIYQCKPLQSTVIGQTSPQEGLLSSQPLCQHFDVVVSDRCLTSTSQEDRHQYQIFLDSVGDSAIHGPYSFKTDRVTIDPCAMPTEFVADEERRDSLIEELMKTEENYVSNMTVFCDLIVKPLKLRARSKNQIIGLYQCNTIFNNIEQILEVNRRFSAELLKWKSTGDGVFGDICAKHLYLMECYTKFLQGVDTAQEINTQEQKSNYNYRTFLQVAKDHPSIGSQTLYDMLAQPGQRIGRYTMLFKEIIKHTNASDKDHTSLIAALKKAEEIATLADDSPTKLAKIFFNMHRSIHNCPASLISQSRTLVSHLDAVELDLSTLKPLRPITIFLLTDKLMIVRRPTYTVRGLELCGIQNENPGFESALLKKLEKSALKLERQLKFKDWVNLEDVELFQGSQSVLSSFTLRVRQRALVRSNPQGANQDIPTYFAEQPTRLYAISLSEVNFNAVANNRDSVQVKNTFIKHFGRSKAKTQRCDAITATYHRQWNGCDVYSNIYSIDQYPLSTYKNDVCLAYTPYLTDVEVRAMTAVVGGPQVICMIEPLGNDSYRLWIRSKTFFRQNSDEAEGSRKPHNMQFADVLCSNLLYWSTKTSNMATAEPDPQLALRRRNSKGIAISQSLSSSKFLSAATSYLPLTTSSISTSRSRPKSMASNSDILKNMESRMIRRNSYASTLNSKTSADSSISIRSATSDMEEPTDTSVISATSNAMFESEYGFDEGIILSTNPTSADITRDKSGDPTESQASTSHKRYQRPKSLSFHLPQIDLHGESFSGSVLESGQPTRSSSRGSMSSSIHSSEPGSAFSTITSRTSTLSTVSNSSSTKRDNIEQKVSQMVQWMQHQQAASVMEMRITALEKVMADADKLRVDLSSRWDHLITAYEEFKLTQNRLVRKIKEKDTEIESIQTMYQDAIDENQILYQTFNEELEQLLKIIERSSIASDHRPAHPTPEEQIKRKLKTALKERNNWQHVASELEKELSSLKSDIQSYNAANGSNSR